MFLRYVILIFTGHRLFLMNLQCMTLLEIYLILGELVAVRTEFGD